MAEHEDRVGNACRGAIEAIEYAIALHLIEHHTPEEAASAAVPMGVVAGMTLALELAFEHPLEARALFAHLVEDTPPAATAQRRRVLREFAKQLRGPRVN